MKRIVYLNDGALCVCIPVINTYPEPENITEDEAIARAMAKLPEAATDIRVLSESAIPASREHRNAWQYNAGKTAVVVDVNAARATVSEAIDADADAIRGAVLGGRTTEYMEALADAEAFAAAAFAGPPPPGVKSWLDAKTAVGAGWSAQQAAQDILDTGAAWKAAQHAIRTARLLRKEQIKAATTQAEIDAALAAWAAFAGAIRASLGLVA